SQINTLQDYNGQLRYKHLDKTYHVQMSPDATVSIQLFLNLATQEVQSNFNGLDVTFDNNEVLVKWYDKFGFVRYPKAQISVFPNVGDQRTGGNRMIDYSATYSEIYDSFERSNASG